MENKPTLHKNNTGLLILGIILLIFAFILIILGFQSILTFRQSLIFSDGQFTYSRPHIEWIFLGIPFTLVGTLLIIFGLIGSTTKPVPPRPVSLPQRPIIKQESAPTVTYDLPKEKPLSVSICPQCKLENNSDAKYCKGCGSTLLNFKYCTRCNAKNDLEAHYCDNCGKEFLEK